MRNLFRKGKAYAPAPRRGGRPWLSKTRGGLALSWAPKAGGVRDWLRASFHGLFAPHRKASAAWGTKNGGVSGAVGSLLRVLTGSRMTSSLDWAQKPSGFRKGVASALQAICLALVLALSARKFHGAYGAEDTLVNLLSWLPVLVRGALLACAIMAAYIAVINRPGLRRAWRAQFHAADVLLHFGLAGVLFAGGLEAPSATALAAQQGPLVLAYYLALPLLWLGYIVFGLRIVLSGWSDVEAETRQKAVAVGIATLLGLVAWRIFERSEFPNATLITEVAVAIAGWFSALLGHPITQIGINPFGWPIYRTGGLEVAIAPSCAGLEGILLSSCLLLAVVLIERKQLRLGRAFVLIAMAAAVSFALNALRIALLLYIGDRISIDVALNGFHSNFGVVSVVVITAMFTWVIRRLAGTARSEPATVATPPAFEEANLKLAIPLMITIAATLLLGMFSGRFNWLYPLPVGLAAYAVWRLRLLEASDGWTITWLPLAAGLLAFFVWIALVPPDMARSAAFEDDLYSAPAVLSAVWLLARIAGSVLIVPITEELAFRGFLLPLAATRLAPRLGNRGAKLVALLATAIGFGLVHSQIAAGITAGLAFGLVYLRRGEVMDAILAHATTNFMVFIYAMTISRWSYL